MGDAVHRADGCQVETIGDAIPCGSARIVVQELRLDTTLELRRRLLREGRREDAGRVQTMRHGVGDGTTEIRRFALIPPRREQLPVCSLCGFQYAAKSLVIAVLADPLDFAFLQVRFEHDPSTVRPCGRVLLRAGRNRDV